MKTVILAGGLGTRLAEETGVRPKPMIEIGGQPIFWHILNIYAFHGHKEFVIACGYKGEMIKQYFCEFRTRNSDMTIDLRTGGIDLHANRAPDWRVAVVDTGVNTQTGGRVRRLRSWL